MKPRLLTTLLPLASLFIAAALNPSPLDAQMPRPFAHPDTTVPKWLARWQAFNEPRLSPGGGAPDVRAHLEAATQVAAARTRLSQQRLAKGASSPGWVPVGPFGPPRTNHTGWLTGIGRINCVAFHPIDSSIMWVGVAQGGVWKTVDGGTTWRPLTDELPILRISDIAVDPNDTDVIYLSVGDFAYIGVDLAHADRKRHTHYGLGVYKTTDGGETWAPTGLSLAQEAGDASLIRRVFIDPRNSARLLAAGAGGTWRSDDAGATWTRGRSDLVWDIERDPVDPDRIYASTGHLPVWEIGRAGLILSTDFGATWQDLPSQIPPTDATRIEIAIAASDPRIVYAVAANTQQGLAGVHRSTDAGASWTQVADDETNILGSSNGGAADRYGQGAYDLAVLVDPVDPQRLYVGGINIWGSTDGGRTWGRMQHEREPDEYDLHPDQHQFAHNPLTGRIVVVNDGGVHSTTRIEMGERGPNGQPMRTRWRDHSGGMNVTSFYRVGTSRNNPGVLIAGAQDNGSYYFDGTEWSQILGGDGMDCFVDHDDPAKIFGSAQYGALLVSPAAGGDPVAAFTAPRQSGERGEWTTPFATHPVERGRIYAGFGNLWTSDGDTASPWRRLSRFDNAPGVPYPTPMSAMAIAPSDTLHYYIAKRIWYPLSLPSEVWGTSDGGRTWRDVTAGLPDSLYVTSLATHASDPRTVWATFGGFAAGAKVYRTSDAGATWTNISHDLPNVPVNTVAHDATGGTLFVGTDLGVFALRGSAGTWEPFGENLPNVIVSDLELHPLSRRLYAATFGRGIWGVDLATSSADDSDADGATDAIAVSVVAAPRNAPITIETRSARAHAGALVEIIDVGGSIVHRARIAVPAAAARQSVATALGHGLYFARLTAEGRAVVARFVVE